MFCGNIEAVIGMIKRYTPLKRTPLKRSQKPIPKMRVKPKREKPMELPEFPKPSDIKHEPVTVRVMKDGREVCNLLTKAGRDEYTRRKRVMWERQKRRCCLEKHIAECPGKLTWSDAVFEHEAGRGHGGGTRDDRIEVDGKPQNGVAHPECNLKKASVKIHYNEAT